jgi:LemA protein
MSTQWIVGAVIVLVIVYAIAVLNRLIRQRNIVREGWSGIDVQLRRRTDLVPNLVDAVRGYAAHERGLFEDLTRHRAASIAASEVGDREAAEHALAGSLSKLMVLAEGYPQLKANRSFLELQAQLALVEDQIEMARRYYNSAVRNLNTSIQSFPELVVARLLSFQAEPFFELEDRTQAAPRVALPAGRS